MGNNNNRIFELRLLDDDENVISKKRLTIRYNKDIVNEFEKLHDMCFADVSADIIANEIKGNITSELIKKLLDEDIS